MAFALRATAAVRDLLAQLRADPAATELWQALSARITLIRTEPTSPRARGVERQMQPSGILARASVVPIIGTDDTWIVVWHLVSNDDGDAIELVYVGSWDG